jgi:uncharacterized protein (DUF2267 family)
MTINELKAIQKTINDTNEWINELMSSYDFENEEEAFLLMRATLKTIRDRINPNEAHHLGAQLPALIRGFYYEGWNPNKNPLNFETTDGFISTVKSNLAGHDNIDLEMAVPEAMRIIFERIGSGQADHVKQNLPAQVQEFLA